MARAPGGAETEADEGCSLRLASAGSGEGAARRWKVAKVTAQVADPKTRGSPGAGRMRPASGASGGPNLHGKCRRGAN